MQNNVLKWQYLKHDFPVLVEKGIDTGWILDEMVQPFWLESP